VAPEAATLVVVANIIGNVRINLGRLHLDRNTLLQRFGGAKMVAKTKSSITFLNFVDGREISVQESDGSNGI
jgi:hypothetical protein